MLIDLHANPGDLSPEEFAEAVRDAGLDAVVVTSTNDVDQLGAYLDALDDLGITAFGGVELALDKGALVLIPQDADADEFADATWSKGAEAWTFEDALERIEGFDGVVIATHPYCQDLPSTLGDRVFKLKSLVAIETRVGCGAISWDAEAESAAAKMGVARVGTSGGNSERLGLAATVLKDGLKLESDLVEALKSGITLPVEFDVKGQARDRRPPRRDGRDDDNRGNRRDGGRGRGRDRDDNRGNRQDDNRGNRRDGGGGGGGRGRGRR